MAAVLMKLVSPQFFTEMRSRHCVGSCMRSHMLGEDGAGRRFMRFSYSERDETQSALPFVRMSVTHLQL
eukprot:2109791-Amphidinium_carterae.1